MLLQEDISTAFLIIIYFFVQFNTIIFTKYCSINLPTPLLWKSSYMKFEIETLSYIRIKQYLMKWKLVREKCIQAERSGLY